MSRCMLSRSLGGYLVHDGGRALGQLEASGLVMTPKKLELLGQLAKRLGVGFGNGMFRMMAKDSGIQEAVFAVGQCCSVAMFELLKHGPSSEEEEIRTRVFTDVQEWGHRRGFAVVTNQKIRGGVKQYTLDLVAYPAVGPIAVNVLVPSYNALVSAERYGFQVLDGGMEGYRKLAVLVHPERWKKARKIVAKLADATAEIEAAGSLLPNNIDEKLDLLSVAS